MLKRIKSVFDKLLAENKSPHCKGAISRELAVTVLLVEVMYADHKLVESERSEIAGLLTDLYGLTDTDAQRHIVMAEAVMDDAVSLHQYTSSVNTLLSYSDKLLFIESLWRVVYADGQVDKYEEHLVRRIADLIYVSHNDFIKAKHSAHEAAKC